MLEGFYKVRVQVDDAIGRGAFLETTALAGRRSLRLTAVLKLLRPV